MTPAARYLATETAVSAAINAVLSAAFVVALFGGRARIAAGDLALDALPQSFMVALMAVIVPTSLTRRRMRAGGVAAITPFASTLPRPAVLRGLLAAVVIAPLAWGLHSAVLPAGAAFAFASTLIAKTVYGALLGASVTALAVRVALGETEIRKG